MPKVSRETAAHSEDMGVMVGHYGKLDGYTVGFETFREDADATPLFKGLPDDRCQSPHWGYVISGQVTFEYADRDEVYAAGDAYYAPPGHVPVITAGNGDRRVQPHGRVRAHDGRGRRESGSASERLTSSPGRPLRGGLPRSHDRHDRVSHASQFSSYPQNRGQGAKAPRGSKY